MSRHRLVKNIDYEDYGDDYDDYDDEDYEDYDQQYAAPPKQKAAAVPSKPTVALQIAVAGKPAMAAVGVTKPPPGWGKPHAPSAAPAPVAAKGFAKPPPGWGKPNAPASAAASASAGISKAPPGWGKPEAATTTTTTTFATKSGATSKTPPRKQQQQGGSSFDYSTSISNQVSSKQPFKPLPEVLKNTRSQLSMVVLGHVDAGKSTLMGQLLVQVGQVNKRTAEKQQLAWLLDEDQGERDHGVTMQIATKSFTTPSHDIVILDAPGHADFIPIMITGAAHADVAILVVAATRGEFESGFEGGGQTKEHVILARGLGVSQVIVAVNKLDVVENNCGNNQDRYQEIQQRVQEYLVQQQFKPARIHFVPLSGLTGENVKECKDETLKSWYKGPTLLEAIDGFQAANRQVEKPLRFVVTDAYQEGRGVVARGRVVQGFLRVGERVVVLPIGDAATVSKLDHLQPPSGSAERLAIAQAGDTVDLVLNGIDLMRLSVGNILANPKALPPIVKKATAKILVMDHLNVPIIRGAQVLFHMHSLDIPAVLTKLIATTNPDGTIKKERPRALTSGARAVVELTLSAGICMEPFSECRALGRFVLRRGGETVAVGVIDELVQ